VESTDLYLAAACAEGDAAAIQHFEKAVLSKVGVTVRRVDDSEAFVDEVRQELRVHLLLGGDRKPRVGSYSGRASLTSWVHGIAARVAITRKRRARAVTSLGSIAVSGDDPERMTIRERYGGLLEEALRETMRDLTHRERNILRLHFVEGMPLERLAHLYGTHRTTLGRWVTLACERIFAGTRRRLGLRLRLPACALDSLVALLKSEVDLSLSSCLREAR
jgi:RNA polymerase sigma-70 factor (ECF subfamily)